MADEAAEIKGPVPDAKDDVKSEPAPETSSAKVDDAREDAAEKVDIKDAKGAKEEQVAPPAVPAPPTLAKPEPPPPEQPSATDLRSPLRRVSAVKPQTASSGDAQAAADDSGDDKNREDKLAAGKDFYCWICECLECDLRGPLRFASRQATKRKCKPHAVSVRGRTTPNAYRPAWKMISKLAVANRPTPTGYAWSALRLKSPKTSALLPRCSAM